MRQKNIGNASEKTGSIEKFRPDAALRENCLCPDCGTTIPHKKGRPCHSTICPHCGSQLMRE